MNPFIYVGGLPELQMDLYCCRRCGALVPLNTTDQHEEWHTTLEENQS